MRKMDLIFMTLAAASLVCGVTLGLYMGLARDFAYGHIHAHLNLIGWVSLAIFGVAYRAFPELQASRLAKVHLALSGPSGALFALGMYLALFQDSILLALVTALMWLAGAVVFLVIVAGQLFAKATAVRAAPAMAD